MVEKLSHFQVLDLNQKILENKSLLCNKKILTLNLTHKKFKKQNVGITKKQITQLDATITNFNCFQIL